MALLAKNRLRRVFRKLKTLKLKRTLKMLRVGN